MRFLSVLRSFASGVVVYLVVAACGASSEHTGSPDGGSPGASSSGGSLVDAISNPVGDAKAQPAAPDVAEEACSVVGRPVPGLGTPLFAVRSYPGKSATELARVAVLVSSQGLSATNAGDQDYPFTLASSVLIRDGSVAVACGVDSPENRAKRLTFVLPR